MCLTHVFEFPVLAEEVKSASIKYISFILLWCTVPLSQAQKITCSCSVFSARWLIITASLSLSFLISPLPTFYHHVTIETSISVPQVLAEPVRFGDVRGRRSATTLGLISVFCCCWYSISASEPSTQQEQHVGVSCVTIPFTLQLFHTIALEFCSLYF